MTSEELSKHIPMKVMYMHDTPRSTPKQPDAAATWLPVGQAFPTHVFGYSRDPDTGLPDFDDPHHVYEPNLAATWRNRLVAGDNRMLSIHESSQTGERRMHYQRVPLSKDLRHVPTGMRHDSTVRGGVERYFVKLIVLQLEAEGWTVRSEYTENRKVEYGSDRRFRADIVAHKNGRRLLIEVVTSNDISKEKSAWVAEEFNDRLADLVGVNLMRNTNLRSEVRDLVVSKNILWSDVDELLHKTGVLVEYPTAWKLKARKRLRRMGRAKVARAAEEAQRRRRVDLAEAQALTKARLLREEAYANIELKRLAAERVADRERRHTQAVAAESARAVALAKALSEGSMRRQQALAEKRRLLGLAMPGLLAAGKLKGMLAARKEGAARARAEHNAHIDARIKVAHAERRAVAKAVKAAGGAL